MPQVSFLDELTALKASFVITEPLSQLLTLTGYDACVTHRNHNSMLWAVAHARDACKNIIKLIEKANGENGTWRDVEAYAQQVIDMEQILIDFSIASVSESVAPRFASGTLEQHTTFITSWINNRASLHNVFVQLDGWGKPGAEKAAIKHDGSFASPRRRDDILQLKGILTELEKPTSRRPQDKWTKMNEHFIRIQTLLNGTESPKEDVFGYAIRFAMGTQVLVNLRIKDSAKVWDLAIEGMTLVKIDASQAALEEKWAAFLKALGIDLALPEEFKQLWRLISGVKRPYYSQSVELAKACNILATEIETKKTQEMLTSFQEVLKETIKALRSAAGAQYDPKTTFNAISGTDGEFDTAKSLIAKFATDNKVSLSTFETDMATRKTEDATRIAAIQGALTKVDEKERRNLSSQTTLTVKEDGPSKKEYSYTVNSSLSLQAILWKIAQTDSAQTTNVLTKGYFHLANTTTPLELDRTVGDLEANKTIHLAIKT